MNNKETAMKFDRRRLLVLFLTFVIVFTGIIPSTTEKAYAADGTITLKVGRVIDYSAWGTHYFYAGEKDHPVFCSQPQMAAPDAGSYEYNFIKPTSMLAKCLYYGLGGPGFEDYTDKKLRGQWDGEDDAYALTHIVISIAYDETTSASVDPYYGLNDTWKTKAKNLYEYIKDLPDPPKNYKAFRIRNEGCQDILGSFNDTGSIKLEKKSANTAITSGSTDYSLKGAKYGVYCDGNLIGTITTDADGKGSLDNVLVEDYVIKELEPSKGYAIDATAHNCKVKTDETTTVTVKEKPKNDPIGILLEKGDAEKNKAVPSGGCTLKGAVYEIKYYKHTSDGKKLDRTWRVKTNEKGIAHLSEADLDKSFDNDKFYVSDAGDPCIPLGTVTVQEVKAPEGYFINDKVYTTDITDDGKDIESVYTYNTPKIGSAVQMAETPKRGDIILVKVKDGTMQRLANVQFKITSKTTGESHIVCTDENGMIDTRNSFNAHKNDTNGGTSESGLWFGEIKAIDPAKGALLYDYYTLDELRGDNNKGLKLAKDIEFRIYRDSAVVDLGTITDDEITLKTKAVDSETGNHISLADNKVTIIDTVQYEHFNVGKTYKIKGTLMDRDTGKPVMVNGQAVTSETEFKCSQEDGTVKVTFEFDATELAGTNVVVFEKAFDAETDEEFVSHEDINDDGQRITIPEIGTQALGENTKANIVGNCGTQTIIDTVAYEKLLPGEKYTLKTWLVDKDGNQIEGIEPVETSFTAEAESGTAEAKISFEADALNGQDVTVFEEVYLGSALVGEHKDTEDEDQTVSIPEIGTKAIGEDTGKNIVNNHGMQTIVDTVGYANLIAGKTYTMKTWLVDKEGKALEGVEPVETEFTAEAEDGSMEAEITFDAEKLAGKDVIVFEEIALDGAVIGEHKDVNDEDQTVNVPDIGTKAAGKDGKTNVIEPKKRQKVIDTVSYHNLIPGQKYELKTWLVDKDGNKIEGTDVISRFTAFNTDGETKAKIVFDATDHAGKKIVVFEEVYLDGKIVGEHKDTGDKDQTVTVEKPEKHEKPDVPVTPHYDTPKTGDTSHLMLYALLMLAALAGLDGTKIYIYRKKHDADAIEIDDIGVEDEEL